MKVELAPEKQYLLRAVQVIVEPALLVDAVVFLAEEEGTALLVKVVLGCAGLLDRAVGR